MAVTQKWLSDEFMAEVDFKLSSDGVTIFCPYLYTPRFCQFDTKGRCPTCKSDNVEIDYTVQREGVTIYCSRMKKEKFIKFDTEIGSVKDKAIVRIRARSRPYNIPINPEKYHAQNEGVKVDKSTTVDVVNDVSMDLNNIPLPPDEESNKMVMNEGNAG